MKVRIKNFNGDLPDYLTVVKEYEVVKEYGSESSFTIKLSNDHLAYIRLENCGYLNGGSWEVVMNREEAIRAMLDGKKVRRVGWVGGGYCMYDTTYRKPFRYIIGDCNEEMKEVWRYEEWEIVPEPKKRPMTREEVLGFIEHNHIRVSYKGNWRDKYFWDIMGLIKDYEYAYIDEKGNISEPMKFEVEE